MLRHRRAKIVATLGPATETIEQIEALFESGVDVFRLNFSHGDHQDKAELIRLIRLVEDRHQHPIGILADLQGPKYRIGQFADGMVDLTAGQSFLLDQNPSPGDGSRVCLPHPELFDYVESGHELLLNDGSVKLLVTAISDDGIETTVIYGKQLSNNKGVNLPDTDLKVSALTDKDRQDVDFILTQDIDWIALSFVQKAEDMVTLQSLVGDKAKLMAKIEKPSAVTDLEDILAVSDAIMIARGDLGVEMPSEQIPMITKRIIRQCRQQGKPVLVATQMLESMIESPKPTRAEASDVATAIYDGADAVMLSAETAVGSYPAEAVATMHAIIQSTESDPVYRHNLTLLSPQREPSIENAICASLDLITKELDIIAVVSYTSSGSTSLRTARERPHALIISVTNAVPVARQLSLVWGIYSASMTAQPQRITDIITSASQVLKKLSLGREGDYFVISAGMPFGVSGTTNFLRIAEVQ